MLITGSWDGGSVTQATPLIWIRHGDLCKTIHPKGSAYSILTSTHQTPSSTSPFACVGAAVLFLYTAVFIFLPFFSVSFLPFLHNTIFLSVFNCSVFSKIASLGPSLLWYELFVSFYCAAVVPGSRLPYDTVSLTQCWRRVWITLITPIFAGIDLYVDLCTQKQCAAIQFPVSCPSIYLAQRPIA